jgi:hypothetical protein
LFCSPREEEPLISAYDIFGAKKRLRDLNLRISGKIITLLDEAHIDIGFHEIVSFIDEMRNSHQTGKI